MSTSTSGTRATSFPRRSVRFRPCMLASSSVERAVVLALRVEDALPVVGLVSPLGVRVDEHLDVTAEEAGANFEHREVLLLNDEAGEGADDRRRGAPVDELASGDLEGGAVERA